MKLLKDDKRAFLSAAAQAQIAVDWLLIKADKDDTIEHRNDGGIASGAFLHRPPQRLRNAKHSLDK
jgi:hypothetical protein